MAEVVRLFPLRKHGVGVYVAQGERAWEVKNGSDKVLSRHRSLEVAFDRCVWHSGTRFAYAKGDEHGACWDSHTRTFVSWDEALETMCKKINQRKPYA